ncbi:MAG: hypothetical protein ACRCXO_08005, partial [Kluyvera intermedia]
MFATSGKFIPVLLKKYCPRRPAPFHGAAACVFLEQIREDLPGCEKGNRTGITTLYPNGIDYAKSVISVELLFS